MNSKELPSYSTNRQNLGDILPLNTPLVLVIDISEVCNFTCNYCFRSNENKNSWGYAKKNNLMNWDLFIKLVEQIKEFKESIKSISLSNHGEPLCNKLLPKMVRYLKQNNINSSVSIHTNASLLTSEYAIELAKSGIDKIVVSIQGINKEKYRDVCNYNISFEEFCNNIKVLYENKCSNTCINIKTVDVALESKEDEEMFYSVFTPLCDKIYIEKVVPIWKEANIDKNEMSLNKFGQKYDLQECCGLTFYTLVVAPDGDIYPCTQLLSPYVLGNINTTTLLDAWNSNMRKNLLIQQLTDNKPKCCADCYIKQNSIFTEGDMIDNYKAEIMQRLSK